MAAHENGASAQRLDDPAPAIAAPPTAAITLGRSPVESSTQIGASTGSIVARSEDETKGDRDPITSTHGLAEEPAREKRDVYRTGVLDEDRVGSGRPTRREHEHDDHDRIAHRRGPHERTAEERADRRETATRGPWLSYVFSAWYVVDRE